MPALPPRCRNRDGERGKLIRIIRLFRYFDLFRRDRQRLRRRAELGG
ncbi:MAG: hypothetical protein L6W00_03700 [Lentisphaeria bacterium]|nr:MAG: hypothetical protein L6W00_03700 [Lentisphaeria bacterium]